MAVEENKKTSTCAYSKTSIRFVNLLECGKLRNHHVRLYSISEKDGFIPDYSKNKEQRDLERYKRFINSSSYDDIRDAETEIDFKTEEASSSIRKIGAYHEDI